MRHRPQVTLSLAALIGFALTGCSSPPPVDKDDPLLGHASKVAATVAERDLIPEGIAHDPQADRTFLGSFRKSKIVAIDANGQTVDFIGTHQDGFQAGVGMRVDAKRRVLWACSATAPHMEDYDPDAPAETGIFRYDVDSGELLSKQVRPSDGLLDFYNDVTLTRDGRAYVSGSGSRKIFKVSADGENVQELVTLPEGRLPNGLDLASDDRILFVSTGDGIIVVDVGSARWYDLTPPDGESLAQIDGLYFYNDSLVAIQGTEQGTRVVRFALSDLFDRITRVVVLDENHPLYLQPTTGVIDGHMLLYIANSQFPLFDESYRLPRRKLHEVVVLRLSLGS
jgi:sugar lactone lactonase YvrE